MNYMNNDPSNGIHYFGASPLANAPRRVFGSFSADGSPVPPHNAIPPGIFADDLSGYGMDDGDHGDHGDPKRRRIARVGSAKLLRRSGMGGCADAVT
jgi:hypothetical protein